MGRGQCWPLGMEMLTVGRIFTSASQSRKNTATVPTQAQPANVAHRHASLGLPGLWQEMQILRPYPNL